MRNMNALLKELSPEGYDALVNEGVERLNALEATLDRIDEMNTDHEFQMDVANHNLHVKHCEEFDKYCDALVNTKGLDTGLVAIGIFNKYDKVAGVLTGKPTDFTIDSAESMVQVVMEAKEGILKRMWEAIKAFFRKLWSFITGKGWNDPKAKIEAIEKDIENARQKLVSRKLEGKDLIVKGNKVKVSEVKKQISAAANISKDVNSKLDKYLSEQAKLENASNESDVDTIKQSLDTMSSEIDAKIGELNKAIDEMFAKEDDTSAEKIGASLLTKLETPINQFIDGVSGITKKLEDTQKKVESYTPPSDTEENPVKKKAASVLGTMKQKVGSWCNTVIAKTARCCESAKTLLVRAAKAEPA